MSSDNDLFIVRRFDAIAARVTLLLQWEVTKLENELLEKDLHCSRGVPRDLHNGSFELLDDERQQVIKEIHTKLKEYCKTHQILPRSKRKANCFFA